MPADDKQLLRPTSLLITVDKRKSLHQYANHIADSKRTLFHSVSSSTVQSILHHLFVVGRHLRRCHADGSMTGVVVQVDQVVQHVQVAVSLVRLKVSKHVLLQHLIESFDHGSSEILVFACI